MPKDKNENVGEGITYVESLDFSQRVEGAAATYNLWWSPVTALSLSEGAGV